FRAFVEEKSLVRCLQQPPERSRAVVQAGKSLQAVRGVGTFSGWSRNRAPKGGHLVKIGLKGFGTSLTLTRRDRPNQAGRLSCLFSGSSFSALVSLGKSFPTSMIW